MNTSLSPLHQLAGILTANLDPDRTGIVGITGSVAAGKSTLAAQLSEALNGSRMTETVSSDGFLFANDVLEARSILLRKGFPESFDQEC